MRFLEADHTKNVCDGAFGHVKQDFRCPAVLLPNDVYKVITDRSGTRVYVQWYEVD